MEREKIRARQFVVARLDQRAGVMAVDTGAAMTGYVLDDRQDCSFEQPRAHRAGQARDAFRVAAIGPFANHRIRSGDRNVQHRQAINGDPEPR